MDIRSMAGREQSNARNIFNLRGAVSGLLLGLAASLIPAAHAQTIPSAVVLKATTLTSINGNAGHIAANNAGDAFYVSQTDNTAYWVKRGTTTPIALLTGLSGGRSVYVDSSNNVFVPSNYSGIVAEIPYVNGGYATGSARASLSACTSSTPVSPCTQFGNGGGGVSYYYQATDLGFDATGNAYLVDAYDNLQRGSNAIEIFKYNGTAYAATVIVQGLSNQVSAQIAVDAKGDIYYADGTNLYTVTAATIAAFLANPSAPISPTSISAGFKAPSGVSVDKYGNVFVTDTSLNQIIELPALNGVAQPGKQFVFDPVYSGNGVAFDGLGDMFYTAYSGGTNLNVARINSFPLGSAAIGTPVSATPTSLTLDFISAQTLTAPVFSGTGSGFSYTAGTCAPGAYTAQQTCTFNVNYTPTAVGLQKGAVTLSNASGAVIATAELLGIGLGAAQTSDPGTASVIGSGFTSPQGIAVDSAKNVFIADAGKNAVYEYVAGSTTAVTIGSGLLKPSSVALDNAGNLYIGDSGNGRVVMVPSIAGVLTTSAQVVIVSGLGSTVGIATDPYGSLYVADSNNNKVTQLAPISGVPSTSASTTITLQTSSKTPFALATDSTGDLFVADTTANTVTEVAYYGKAVTNIGTGYSHPSGLAVDASASLYVADPGNVRLIKIPFESPIYNPNDQYSVGPAFTLATGISLPYGVAIDSSANLYVVDNQDASVTFLNRQQGTLNLGNSNTGSTTAQQSAYIADAGNQPLVAGNPEYTTVANSAFTITAPSTSGCVNSATLQPGFSCVLQATFSPATVGTFTQVLAFNDNAANTATPQLTLTGVGEKVAVTTLGLTQTSPVGTAAFGQTIVIAATIGSTTTGTPSGDIIFYVDGNFFSVVKVTGSTQSINVTGLLGGTHTIAASYTGDNTFAPSNQTLSITVTKALTGTVVTGTGGMVSQYPAIAPLGASVTLTATITPNAVTVPTGTVTFVLGSTTLGTASVVTVSGAYVASINTTALVSGSDNVVAIYSGDVNYFGSNGTLVFLVSPQTFTISPAAQSANVGTAGSTVLPLQFSSISGFGPAYVSLTCAGLPANTTCAFAPNGFPLQANNLLTNQLVIAGIQVQPFTYGPVVGSVTITTGNTPVVTPPTIVAALRNRGSITLALLALTPFTLLLRRRSLKRLSGPGRLLSGLVLLALGVGSFSGCGSNLVGVTPTGTYHITITATATDAVYPTITTASPAGPGCVVTPAGSTAVTCTQIATVTLVVQ